MDLVLIGVAVVGTAALGALLAGLTAPRPVLIPIRVRDRRRQR